MNSERLSKILVSPVVSEKSTRAADQSRQMVFKVLADASKPEIRKAVEQMFDVSVTRVQVSNVKAKVKRFGRGPHERRIPCGEVVARDAPVSA